MHGRTFFIGGDINGNENMIFWDRRIKVMLKLCFLQQRKVGEFSELGRQGEKSRAHLQPSRTSAGARMAGPPDPAAASEPVQTHPSFNEVTLCEN